MLRLILVALPIVEKRLRAEFIFINSGKGIMRRHGAW